MRKSEQLMSTIPKSAQVLCLKCGIQMLGQAVGWIYFPQNFADFDYLLVNKLLDVKGSKLNVPHFATCA